MPSSRVTIAALLATGALGLGCSIATGTPVNIYGIDDNNSIWEIDPVAKQFTLVDDTALSGSQQSNSMAYDTDRDQFFFTYRGDSTLRFWDRTKTGAGSTPSIATWGQIGLASTDPANAAYYDNAYWYMAPNAQVLRRIGFAYAGGIPAFATNTPYQLAASGYPASGYGDIAINVKSGVLYGTTTAGRFYSIDLSRVGQAGSYREIRTGLPSLQVSFNADYSTLYAHSHPGGRWYTLDTSNGALTDLDFTTVVPGTPNGFRDLGGASTTTAGSVCGIAPPGVSNDQAAQVGTAVRYPPQVRITGPDGAPQASVEVLFTVTGGGGALGGQQSATVRTDANGVATAPAWTMGSAPGRNIVLADSVGTTCNLSFSATATVGPPPDPDPEEGKPQKPVRPVVLPESLIDPGTTTLVRVPVRTNARQVATVRVTCNIRGTGRAAPTSRCRSFVERRVLKVRVTCGRALWVRVLITAPATGDYRAFRQSKTYTTSGRCGVTG